MFFLPCWFRSICLWKPWKTLILYVTFNIVKDFNQFSIFIIIIDNITNMYKYTAHLIQKYNRNYIVCTNSSNTHLTKQIDSRIYFLEKKSVMRICLGSSLLSSLLAMKRSTWFKLSKISSLACCCWRYLRSLATHTNACSGVVTSGDGGLLVFLIQDLSVDWSGFDILPIWCSYILW